MDFNYDYYKNFKQGAVDAVGKTVTQRDNLVKAIEKARKNLRDEQNRISSLKLRIQKLKEKSSESLTDDKMSFEAFKVSLQKLNVELSTAEESVALLEKDVLPKAERDLQNARQNISILLRQYLFEVKPTAEDRIKTLLSQAEAERSRFLDAFHKIYLDCGEVFVANSESLIPGAWRAREVLEPVSIAEKG